VAGAKQKDQENMSISAEALLVVLLVGLIAGWLTAQVLQRASFGLVGDIAIGVCGATLGGWLLPQLGASPGCFAAAVINATVGAVSLLLIAELFRGGSASPKKWLGW
jgi:uncharacterized membrane protein YeaQ/YmgE (transglycosylase-associated protein family)